jgi:hypothetical protein
MFTMLVVPNVDFPGKKGNTFSDDHKMTTTKWILRRKYGSRGLNHAQKMDCKQQEVQRITTITTTYKRNYTRILMRRC